MPKKPFSRFAHTEHIHCTRP